MATQLFNTVFYGLVAGLATILGILLVLYFEKFARKNSTYLISFAAGVLMASALIFLVPESQELTQNALIFVLIGFLIFYLLEHFIVIHSCHEENCQGHALDKVAVIGIGFHSLIDGIAIAVGFEISAKIGLIATLAVILHELPEGITTLSILLHRNIKKKLAIIFSLIVALATPVGAILTYFFVIGISESILGILLAVTAGSFIYIAATDLVPETHIRFNKLNALVLLIGVFILYFIGKIVG